MYLVHLFFEGVGGGGADVAGGGPFGAADDQDREDGAGLHGGRVVAERVFDDATFAVIADPDHGLVLAGVLRVLGGVGIGGDQHLAIGERHRVLIELVVGVRVFALEVPGDRMLGRGGL